MSGQGRQSLPSAATTVSAAKPTQLGSFNPCKMFHHASQSMLNPYATGFLTAAPFYGCVLPPAVAVANYSQHLAAGLGRTQRSWASTTLRSRASVQQELSRWLASLPPIFAKTWYTLEPLDIICFMEAVWIPHHAGVDLPNGKGKVVAPSSLSGGWWIGLCAVWKLLGPAVWACCQAGTGVSWLPLTLPWCASLPCRDHLTYQHQYEADWKVR